MNPRFARHVALPAPTEVEGGQWYFQRYVEQLPTSAEERAFVEFAVLVEDRVIALLDELKPGRELRTNVEFYAGVVMELCGVPRSMFTPTFASSRPT